MPFFLSLVVIVFAAVSLLTFKDSLLVKGQDGGPDVFQCSSLPCKLLNIGDINSVLAATTATTWQNINSNVSISGNVTFGNPTSLGGYLNSSGQGAVYGHGTAWAITGVDGWLGYAGNYTYYNTSGSGAGVYGKAVDPGYDYAGHFDGPVVFAGSAGTIITSSDGSEIKMIRPNAGSSSYLTIIDSSGNPRTLLLTGNLSVTGTKNFQIPYPNKPGMDLVHSSLEGPEIAVFYRGEAILKNGKATVSLPDYFEALTRKDGRTVLLTPKFDSDEPISTLAASEVKEGKFSVRSVDDKNPSQKFYWEVKAVRADVKPLEVEKPRVLPGK